jgi:3-hydroxy-9,10-secoandrosta-1,3,5(10)-triene-9,17-dione monooxygenase
MEFGNPSLKGASMSHEVVNRVEQIAAQLASTAEETENLGTLSVQNVKLIRQAGVMRMLQPTDFGGNAAHPRDFAEAVMAVAKACGSTGWGLAAPPDGYAASAACTRGKWH